MQGDLVKINSILDYECYIVVWSDEDDSGKVWIRSTGEWPEDQIRYAHDLEHWSGA